MKTQSSRAFTLIEMLTVMAVIAVLASLILAVASLVNTKAAKDRAQGEISTLTASLEAYNADNGAYPSNADSEELDPRQHGSSTGGKYQRASQFLYAALANDLEPADAPDGKPEATGRGYFDFKANQLGGPLSPNQKNAKTNSAPDQGKVTIYMVDPFGNSYGYSTRGARAEAEFRELVRLDPKATREKVKSNHQGGFNPNFDIWSTGGKVSLTDATDEDRKKWVKNW